jgi:hypothetical protein
VQLSSSPLGARPRANDSLPHADPCDGPSVGLPSTCAGPRRLPKAVLFRRSITRSHLATTDSGRPTVSECEGERRPLRPEVVPQHPIGVSPCGGVAPPHGSGSPPPPNHPAAQRRQTANQLRSKRRSGSSEGPRRDTEGTASSLGNVPSHTPCVVPSHLQSRQQTRPSSTLALGRPSGRLTRGERRPLRSKTSTQLRSTFVPCGTSLPPRSNS